ncbi:MAG TPA: UDP-N-acetylmuramate dehydrogenase [Bacteroidota bacterium]|nr:UDP-N-acetylmuramate dehydrogenase [Bacteroidota bacterium]
MISLSEIKEFFRGTIRVNEPLSSYTWMKVGGPADYYMEPVDREDLFRLVDYLKRHEYPYFIIGRGSNLLVSDEGIRGAVLNLERGFNALRIEGDLIVAEAGVRLSKFVDFCIQHSLAGVEMLPGIPGTIGGAVVMNAGAYGGETADYLVEVEALRDGRIQKIPKEAGDFSYRRSGFENDVVISASFRLPKGNKEELQQRRRELIMKRNETQPLELPNSGSMFKNPPGTYAAKLIEQVGLKGKRIGGAQISERHANFIVNLGGAKADDIARLLDLARRSVYQYTGILMELEVKLVGFPTEVKENVA